MYDTFTRDLSIVLDHGGTAPEQLHAVQARSRHYSEFRHHFTALFADAVVNDAPEDEILHLRALALIEQTVTTVEQASVLNVMRLEVGRAVDVLYQPVALANWDTIAERFNTAAEAFTKAHRAVPVNTDPASLVTAPDRSRKAWAEGQTQRTLLDGLVEPLLAAARLAGRSAGGKTWAIGATTNAEGLHRRRVWKAWDEESRWSALVDLGATIHAPDLDDLEPYREPAPIETRMEPRGIGWVPVEYDPEDNIATSALPAEDVAAILSSHT